MNTRSPGMALSCGRRRLITSHALSRRSDSGFRLMKSCPRLTEELNDDVPIDEPTPAIAGSASTMSLACCCRSYMAWNEISGEAWVEPQISPVSSGGNQPFGVLT